MRQTEGDKSKNWIEREDIRKIVSEIGIDREDAVEILAYCNRKMDVAKIENREEYLPLLFKDEIGNYFFREAVNVTTMLRQLGKGGIVCAICAE